MKRIYYDTKDDLEEGYKAEDLDHERLIRETDDLILKDVEKEIRVKHATTPRMEEINVEPLKRATPEIIGGLFDRVKFLKQRIEEINNMISTRTALHDQVVVEINADINEKSAMESRLTDMDEKRNFKLDISILRKEKRHEQLQFWRDVLELKTELRELMEQHETESKIVGLFGEGGNDAIHK